MKKDKAKKKAADQPNLFGEQDLVYNALQEEISYLVAMIATGQDSIVKKEAAIEELLKRKANLDKAAAAVAKLRDGILKKKEKKKKD